MSIPIFLSILYITYALYAIFVLDRVVKTGNITNGSNIEIERLRRGFGERINTFFKQNTHRGYTEFRTIYLNDCLFDRKDNVLRRTFIHELYHLRHRHYIKLVLFRFMIGLTPLLSYVFNNYIVLIIFLTLSCLAAYVRNRFEMKAREAEKEYSKDKYSDEEINKLINKKTATTIDHETIKDRAAHNDEGYTRS